MRINSSPSVTTMLYDRNPLRTNMWFRSILGSHLELLRGFYQVPLGRSALITHINLHMGYENAGITPGRSEVYFRVLDSFGQEQSEGFLHGYVQGPQDVYNLNTAAEIYLNPDDEVHVFTANATGNFDLYFGLSLSILEFDT